LYRYIWLSIRARDNRGARLITVKEKLLVSCFQGTQRSVKVLVIGFRWSGGTLPPSWPPLRQLGQTSSRIAVCIYYSSTYIYIYIHRMSTCIYYRSNQPEPATPVVYVYYMIVIMTMSPVYIYVYILGTIYTYIGIIFI